MGVIEQFITAITKWVQGFVTILVGPSGLFPSMIALFYTPQDGLTTFGILGLMGIGVGLIYLAINFIRRMFKA